MAVVFVARLHSRRRPIVMIAAGLLVLQTFFAGLAGAGAAAALATNLAELAFICHGGGTDFPGGPAPDSDQAWHLCCVSCTAGAPPATLPQQTIALRSERAREVRPPAARAVRILVAARAVRAGSSQAPPSLG
jgi:hypothetical protein